MQEPLLVQIIAYAPAAFYHCMHCEVAWKEIGAPQRIHQEQLESSLPEDLAADYQALSDWVRELFRGHGDRVLVKVIDAASIEGVYKSLRHRAHRYPAVILGGGARFAGMEGLQAAGREVARRLAAQPLEF